LQGLWRSPIGEQVAASRPAASPISPPQKITLSRIVDQPEVLRQSCLMRLQAECNAAEPAKFQENRSYNEIAD